MGYCQVEGIHSRLPHVAPPLPIEVGQEGRAITASTDPRGNDVKTARVRHYLALVGRRRLVPNLWIPESLYVQLHCSKDIMNNFCELNSINIPSLFSMKLALN